MSDELPTQMYSKSNPVLWLSTASAIATAMLGVVASQDGVPTWVKASLMALVGLCTVLGGIWARGQVTPWVDVASKRAPNGALIMGPASVTGEVGDKAAVVPLLPGRVPPSVVVEPQQAEPDPGAGNGMNPPYPGL